MASCIKITKTQSLISMLVLTSSFFLVEIIVGYSTNSMALVADSFHMLSDVVSLFVGYFALRYSKKITMTESNTFGWQRAEVLGGLVNAVFLIALCFSILVESLKRLVSIEPLHDPKLILVVGGVGLAINLLGMALFHHHGHGHSHGHSHGSADKHTEDFTQAVTVSRIKRLDDESSFIRQNESAIQEIGGAGLESLPEIEPATHAQSSSELTVHKKVERSSAQLNMRGVYLHVLGDALGSIIVMISATVILLASGEWTLYVDPVMSILMVCIIMKTSIPLLRESSMILLQNVPTHIKIKDVEQRLIERIEGIISVHEFHVWQLAGDKIIASAHVTCQCPDDYMKIAEKIKDFFHDEGIHSTTIQPEFVQVASITAPCVLKCSTSQSCAAQTCCGEEESTTRQRKKAGSQENNEETQVQFKQIYSFI